MEMHSKTIRAVQKQEQNAVSPSWWFTQLLRSSTWRLTLPWILSPAPKTASRHQPNWHTTTQSHGKASTGETHLATALPVFGLLRGWPRRLDREGAGKEEGSFGIFSSQILKISEEGWRLPLKAELHLTPVSHDGALRSRSWKSHCKNITFKLHIWGWVA